MGLSMHICLECIANLPQVETWSIVFILDRYLAMGCAVRRKGRQACQQLQWMIECCCGPSYHIVPEVHMSILKLAERKEKSSKVYAVRPLSRTCEPPIH